MTTYRRMLKDKDGNNIIPAGILDAIYPVGSIYMSATLATAADVGNALGGTWESWGAGKVPVGVNATETEFNTVEKTGGEKKHTLTTSELPSHTHPFYGTPADATIVYIAGVQRFRYDVAPTSRSDTYPASTNATGDGASHNNLQPYITCYMYKRTA